MNYYLSSFESDSGCCPDTITNDNDNRIIMEASEYLAFLPLLIYGIALADLFSQWKRFFNLKEVYIPYLLLTIILTETALYNVFIYAELIDQLAGLSYFSYLLYLIPPFLFMLTANIFTPDKDSDTEEYFLRQMPVFLSLLALFSASHFLYDFNENFPTIVGRMTAILIIIITGISRKIWMFYIVVVLWIFLLFVKGGMIST